ncbi:MAG TPA: hypothetical protein VGP82_25775 [Ktedonobacterales bacterium]|nr:hypothetical protein [Ktedonobacterales bacterium]
MGDDNRDGWDGFDFSRWGETPADNIADSVSVNGATPLYGDDDEAPREGHWVTEGGVLKWEEPEGREDVALDLRAEAGSPWAADDPALPLGAPESARHRAVRAWLARQHLLENEAIGFLLLERRRLQADSPRDEDGEVAPETRGDPSADDDPISLAVAEHQAAIEEYEGMLGALDDLAVHSGSSRVLVEFFLLINERLLDLAIAPAAPDDFARQHFLPAAERSPATAPPTARSRAEWQGHAEAVLRTRSRVERMSAPEPEE